MIGRRKKREPIFVNQYLTLCKQLDLKPDRQALALLKRLDKEPL